MSARERVLELKARMGQSIIGQEAVIDRLLIGLLANGNLLVEGLPGLAKTRAIKALAKNLAADFSRIQFTPDLLPSDVTGTEVYYSADGKGEFRFEPGPIFANVVLAENRAKTMALWTEPFITLRMFKIFNLRRDPFEKAEHNSNSFYDWMIDKAPQGYLGLSRTAAFLQTFSEYPPSQRPDSWSIDRLTEQLLKAE